MKSMVRRAALAALTLFAVSGARGAEPKTTLILPGGNGEILAMTPPAGWNRGWSGAENDTTVVEWRKAQPGGGEGTITVMRVGGLSSADPAEFIRQSVAGLKPQCGDVVEGRVRPDKSSGAVRTAIGCTRRKSDGRGELQLLHIAVGREALYVARRIWELPAYDKAKIPLSPETIAAGGADIDDLRLCDLSGAGAACPAGLAAALKDKITDLSPLELKTAAP